MKQVLLPLAAGLALTACSPPQPKVTSFNGHSISVVTSQTLTEKQQSKQAWEEAARVCGRVGKTAEYASQTADQRARETRRFFLCL
ncbi:hypothetical protein IV417_08225 [Alphaproteobacteria bacterium KMM 3653]|uniref:Lipoprotein n=1 Tax=Harenicola maris TaxID=2841044 RepID=A0AAP2CN59_9RHOB|nr:hypothetical protein [Harenicola maris]